MRVPVNLVQFCYIQYIVSSGTPRQLIVPCVDMPSRAPSLPLAVRQRSQRAFADFHHFGNATAARSSSVDVEINVATNMLYCVLR